MTLINKSPLFQSSLLVTNALTDKALLVNALYYSTKMCYPLNIIVGAVVRKKNRKGSKMASSP